MNDRVCFPNLARSQQEHENEKESVTATVKTELEAAGITPSDFGFLIRGEVPSTALGFIEGSGWKFERRWYYYAAEGNGIPPDIAMDLHNRFGREVRVGGDCGCPSPLQSCKGFAVGSYHVDTPAGLKALADTIKGILAAHTPADKAA